MGDRIMRLEVLVKDNPAYPENITDEEMLRIALNMEINTSLDDRRVHITVTKLR